MIDELEKRIDYSFTNQRHLKLALSHKSWSAEKRRRTSYERLEFLGDSVLGLVVSEMLYFHDAKMREGEMAKVKSEMVNSETLGELAKEIDLGAYLRLGKAEEGYGGRKKLSLLANAYEALIGAIFLDGGLPQARIFLEAQLGLRLREAAKEPGGRDYKSRLQEAVVALGLDIPSYEILSDGPNHEQVFVAQVKIGDEVWGSGSGKSVKLAQRSAAQQAWETRIEVGV